jgi:hypothetical protein
MKTEMKTPLQELIDTFEEMRSPIDSKVDVDFAISLVKSMLEKEKEAIVNAWMDDRYPLDKDWVKQCAEQYYEETFNTKER